LDGLNGHTMQIALLGEVGTKQEIAGLVLTLTRHRHLLNNSISLREQMRTQDQKHKEGIIEIQGNFHFLKKKIF